MRIGIMLKIGNIELDMPFFQGSLSGYTDEAMRSIARQFGSPLTLTGVMLDKTAACAKARRSLGLDVAKNEQPVAAQIMGATGEMMAKAAGALEETGFDIIDLNIACPAPKVLRRRRGGYLLKDPQRVRDIFLAVRGAVKCPVMMKLRIGYGGGEQSRDCFWQICENATGDGVDALVVHGRSVCQLYRGRADWEIIAEVKQRFPETIVIGSGDIYDAEEAIERIETYKLDGVLVARGAIGNPWIFSDLKALWKGDKKPEPATLAEQGEVILSHYDMISARRRHSKGVRYFRKFAARYCKRHPERKKAQLALMAAKTGDQLTASVKEWFGV
ncbi:MAG: hypothetical protein FVQ79_13695 [Planctomycetes bacterium]|nr:hypothetical protein [Planctomycetota bacterium]